MKRRDFIASVGTSVGAVSAAVPVSAFGPTDFQGAELQSVTRAIHAHFGDGFTVCSAHRTGGETTCLIENRGNRLRVSSRDDADWIVRRASEM